MNDFLNNRNTSSRVVTRNENKARNNGLVEKTFNNAEDLFDWIYLLTIVQQKLNKLKSYLYLYIKIQSFN